MSEKKDIKITVERMIAELNENPSKRFSKADFQTLVYAVLSDKDFKAKRYLLKNEDIQEDEVDLNAGMVKFMDKLLKHAGMGDSAERANVIETFEYSPKDIEWIADAVDEASFIYTDCNKNMRMFRDKMLQLTIKKMVRTGKYEGKITYKKMVADKAAALSKRKAKAKA